MIVHISLSSYIILYFSRIVFNNWPEMYATSWFFIYLALMAILLLHLFTASYTCSIRFPYPEHFYMQGWDVAYTLSETRDYLARVEPDSEDWLPHVPPARLTFKSALSTHILEMWFPFPFLARLGRPCLYLPKGNHPLLASTCRPGLSPGYPGFQSLKVTHTRLNVA